MYQVYVLLDLVLQVYVLPGQVLKVYVVPGLRLTRSMGGLGPSIIQGPEGHLSVPCVRFVLLNTNSKY